jgi:2-polyprenyl-6-methoxyphenol hydroxylase-like FAD-dependent oxidoreductase
MQDERVPVLVVGAGLSGLSAAMFLGVHGIRALVVERHATTSIYPKARGQFPHTMEALRVGGVVDRMLEASPGGSELRIVIGDSVTGRVFKELIVDDTPDFSALSPAGWCNASQERAEPVLLERAVELGAEVRFATELESFTQDDGGVTAVLRDRRTGERSFVRADYLVGADGHRSPVREALGIGTHGRGELGRSIGVVFEADLGRSGFGLYYLQNPGLPGGAGAVVSTDEPNRYALSVGFKPDTDRVEDFTDARWVELIRTATGVADLAPKLVDGGGATTYTAVRVADRFSAGRVHLIGDAVRVMPPTGGMGGNTAILDGYYLAWKLAMVLRGEAGPGLLDSHDPERRPYADLLVEQQYTAFVDRMRPDLRDGTLAAPVEPVSALFFGYRHLSDAVLVEPGDDRAPLENPSAPTGRPGSRAPHVWLDRDGQRVSTVELFGRRFVLLVGSAGDRWVHDGMGAGAALGIPLDFHRIGADLSDVDGQWASVYGVSDEGAVLVRPDGFVAWRSPGAGAPGELEAVLRKVLDRPER